MEEKKEKGKVRGLSSYNPGMNRKKKSASLSSLERSSGQPSKEGNQKKGEKRSSTADACDVPHQRELQKKKGESPFYLCDFTEEKKRRRTGYSSSALSKKKERKGKEK